MCLDADTCLAISQCISAGQSWEVALPLTRTATDGMQTGAPCCCPALLTLNILKSADQHTPVVATYMHLGLPHIHFSASRACAFITICVCGWVGGGVQPTSCEPSLRVARLQHGVSACSPREAPAAWSRLHVPTECVSAVVGPCAAVWLCCGCHRMVVSRGHQHCT